jgi:hypothetical protein
VLSQSWTIRGLVPPHLPRAESPVPQLDTVQLDSTHGPAFLHADAQLAKFRTHLDWMDTHSLGPEESRELIHAVAREL